MEKQVIDRIRLTAKRAGISEAEAKERMLLAFCAISAASEATSRGDLLKAVMKHSDDPDALWASVFDWAAPAFITLRLYGDRVSITLDGKTISGKSLF